MRAAMLGPSWMTSTTAPARNGYRRAFRALGALRLGRGEPDAVASALMSTLPRRCSRVPNTTEPVPLTGSAGAPPRRHGRMTARSPIGGGAHCPSAQAFTLPTVQNWRRDRLEAHRVDPRLRAGAHAGHERPPWRSTNLGDSLGCWRVPPHDGHCWSAPVVACLSRAARQPRVPAPQLGGAGCRYRRSAPL